MLELEDIAEVVAGAVREATTPLLARIDALEKRESGGTNGARALALFERVDAEVVSLTERVAELDARPLPELPDVKALVTDEVSAAVSALPPVEPGEVDMDAVAELIGKAVDSLPKPQDGKSVEPDDVRGMVTEAVSAAVERLPVPKDGVGLADALKDADGNLVLVMTDGRTKSLGKIDGKDGEPGLGFDDLRVEQVNDRIVRFVMERGLDVAEFDVRIPAPIYRGVFKESETYEPGDLTTWAGSLWHLNEPKGLKPGAPDSGWQLAAKAGRPGKDAK